MLREKLSSEPLSAFTHELDRIRKRMVTSVREPYLKLAPLERQAMLTTQMNNCIGFPDFVSEFLSTQGGSERWEITEADKKELPPQALQRWEKSFERRSSVLWPWLLFDKSNEQMRKDYMGNYL